LKIEAQGYELRAKAIVRPGQFVILTVMVRLKFRNSVRKDAEASKKLKIPETH
jgi:hypothetical protein